MFSVTTDQVQEPGGVRARRDVIWHSGSIVVLAVDDHPSEPRVLLERQYRHAAGQMMWELPAGRIDDGERELAAAKRELLEETGYTATPLEEDPAFLRESRISGRDHEHLSGSRTQGRNRPARRRMRELKRVSSRFQRPCRWSGRA